MSIIKIYKNPVGFSGERKYGVYICVLTQNNGMKNH